MKSQEDILLLAQFCHEGSEILKDANDVPYALRIRMAGSLNWTEFEYSTNWNRLHEAYEIMATKFKAFNDLDRTQNVFCLNFGHACVINDIGMAFDWVVKGVKELNKWEPKTVTF